MTCPPPLVAVMCSGAHLRFTVFEHYASNLDALCIAILKCELVYA